MKKVDSVSIEKREKVSQEEFDKKFEEMMGVPFLQMLPEWYEPSKNSGRWDASL